MCGLQKYAFKSQQQLTSINKYKVTTHNNNFELNLDFWPCQTANHPSWIFANRLSVGLNNNIDSF